jgi:hypothetical protein
MTVRETRPGCAASSPECRGGRSEKAIAAPRLATDAGDSRAQGGVTIAAGIVFPHARQTIQVTRRTRPVSARTGKKGRWRTETGSAIAIDLSTIGSRRRAAATLGALIAGRRDGRARGWLAAGAVGLLSSDALAAYIVRALNVPLFVAGQPLPHGERRALLRTWYRLTAARIALCGGASVMATIAHRQLRSS